MRALPICVAERWLLVDVRQILEVLGRRAFRSLPGSSRLAPGVIVWRGRGIAVLDLACASGIAARPLIAEEPAPRTIVVGVGGRTLALPVDATRDVEIVPDATVLDLLGIVERSLEGETNVV